MRLFTAIIAFLWAASAYAADPTQVLWGNQAGSPNSIVFKSGSSWIPIGTYNGTTFSPVLPRLAAQSVDCNPTGATATAVSCTTLPTGLIYPYQSSDTGAQPQTINSILSNIVIATNYMSAAQVADVESYTGSLDLTTTLNQILANNAGGTVILPDGKWRHTRHLSCPAGTTIQGVGWAERAQGGGSSPYEPNVGTVLVQDYLYADDPKGIELTGSNCTIANLEIRQPQAAPGVGWTPTAGPWAIYAVGTPYSEAGGHAPTVRNVMFGGVSKAILSDIVWAGLYKDIYGQVFDKGIVITGNGGGPAFENINIGWTYWSGDSNVLDYQNTHLDGLSLGRVDTPRITNISIFQANRAIRAYYDTSHGDGNYDGGPTGVVIANADLDNCVTCVALEDSPEIYFSNLRAGPSVVLSSQCIASYGVVNPGANFSNLRLTVAGGACIVPQGTLSALDFAYEPSGTPVYPQYIKLTGFRITQPFTGSWSSGHPAIATPSHQATVIAPDLTVDNVTDIAVMLGGNGQLVSMWGPQTFQGNVQASNFSAVSAQPSFFQTNTDAGANLKTWRMLNDLSGVWRLAAGDDTNTTFTDAIIVQRSGATPSQISFNATTTAPTPASSDNSTKVATTAFVKSQFGTAAIISADATGVVDATAIYNAAIAAQTAGECSIITPPGIYRIDGPVNVNKTCTLSFYGRGTTTIKTTQATGDVFNITAASVTFSGGVSFTSTVTRTSGAYIKCDSIRCHLSDIWADTGFRGIDLTNNSTLSTVSDYECRSFTPDVTQTGASCIAFTGSGSVQDSIVVTNMTCATDLADSATSCAEIQNAAAPTFINPQFLQAKYDILFNPGAGQTVTTTKIVSGFLDSSKTAALAVIPTSTGHITRIEASGTWFGSGQGYGVYISATASGTYGGFKCEGCEFAVNVGNCFDSNGFDDIQIHGGYMSNCPIAVAISGGAVSRLAISDVDIGNNIQGLGSSIVMNAGIQLYTNVTDAHVHDNKFIGLAANAILGANYFGTTGKVHDNIGYNPVGVTNSTTVGASPATICAGPSPETHYYSQSATNTATVKLGGSGGPVVGTMASTNTPVVVSLGANECTYVEWLTTAPTYSQSVH